MKVRGLIVASAWCALFGGAGAGCGAMDLGLASDLIRVDASGDTASTDTANDTDVRAEATPLFALKPDPRYLVPGGIAERTALAASGGSFAWIERAPSDGGTETTPVFVAWDEPSAASAPQSFAAPNAAHPRELAVSDTWLVYVDDRFGDDDLFAIERATGLERPIARRPGPARTPTLAGARVAWAECPTCVTGDGDDGMEIFELDLSAAGATPARLTTNAVADRAPSFGSLANGQLALAWAEGPSKLHVVRESGGFDLTIDVLAQVGADRRVAGLGLDSGVIGWRPQPVIVNPDIMYPSDVFATTLADQTTTDLAARVVLRPAMAPATPALAGRVAWLEADGSVPGNAANAPGRAQVATFTGLTVTSETIPGLTGLALGRAHVAFMAPRADNGGLSDVWVLPLGP